MSKRFVRYDTPHGLIALTGKDRHDLLHRLCTQDCRTLSQAGQTARALILTHQGRLLDWIELVETGDALFIACALGRAQKLIDWLDGFTIMEDVNYRLIGEAVPSVTLASDLPENWWQAPISSATWGADDDVAALAALAAHLGLVQVPTATGSVSLPSTTADDGVRVLRAHPALGAGLKLMALSGEGQLPAALLMQLGPVRSALAWEARRIVAGLPSPEFEYDEPAMPFELRLIDDNVHWHKGCYIGQEVISRLEAYDKVTRQSMGIVAHAGAGALQQAGARAGKIYVDGKVQGRLTSFVPCHLLAPDAPKDALVGLATLKRTAVAGQVVQLRIAAGEGAPDEVPLPPAQAIEVPATLCDRALWAKLG